jgi:hypothetical protein
MNLFGIEVMNLFGIAIHTSLERTLGNYLKATDGIYRNELRDNWQLEKVSALLCTNNPAERPFAVAKAYLKIYQSMSIRTLAGFGLSICNGSDHTALPKLKANKNVHATKLFENAVLP